MLLVDDDQAEIGERQEERGARPDDRARLAARDRPPCAFALSRGEAGMPLRGPRAEAGREPVEELGGQRDLGQQHERLPALPQRLGDRLEIDLRLARAGDAFEQGGGEGAGGDAGGEIVGRGPLVGVEDRRPMIRIEAGCDRLGRQFDEGERAVLYKPVDHADRAAGEIGERGLGDGRGALRRPLIRPASPATFPPRGKGSPRPFPSGGR